MNRRDRLAAKAKARRSGEVVPKVVGGICLNLICKDEEAVIARCIDSCLPLINCWCIVDTGSTDRTKEIIRAKLGHLPGELLEEPWENFAVNKTSAIRHAKRWGDWALLMDADDTLIFDQGFRWPALTADGYELLVRYGNTEYTRTHLIRLSKPWRYIGVRHEYVWPVNEDGSQAMWTGGGQIEGIHFQVIGGGARSRDPDKFLHDAQALEEDLKKDPNNPRTMFYIGQSYRDAGRPQEAAEWYLRCARVDPYPFPEEKFVALWQAARAMTNAGDNFAEKDIQRAFLMAWESRPTRAEPLHDLARYLRLKERYHMARMYAAQAMALKKPKGERLFIDHEIYHWRSKDECAVSAAWSGNKLECGLLSRELLALPDTILPPIDRSRIQAGYDWCRAEVEENDRKTGPQAKIHFTGSVPLSTSVEEEFHKKWYDSYCWVDLKWRGVLIRKNPMDLMAYQEILWETRPTLIVETGTQCGGSARFLRDMMDLVCMRQPGIAVDNMCQVISIDVDHSKLQIADDLEEGGFDQLVLFRGSSTGEMAFQKVQDLLSAQYAAGITPRVMVILDSDHSFAHVAAEMDLYAPLVTEGQYLIVEDTNVNGHPVLPTHGLGPYEAVEAFLALPETQGAWERDRSRERTMMTWNPGGFLRRKPKPVARPTLCLLVVGKNPQELAAFNGGQYLEEVDELVQVVTTDARFGGIAKVANRYLRETACEVFGMVHADVTLAKGSLTSFARHAASGKVAGLVGRALDGSYVWSHAVTRETPVSTVDGCSIFFRTDASWKEPPVGEFPCLRFDEATFQGFHCVTEDLCLQALRAGIPVEVPPAEARHLSHTHTEGGPKFEAWQKDYWADRQKLVEKWARLMPGVEFQTT